MGLVYPKNYPVAEVVSVSRRPGQPYATIKARPRARFSSTRHVMLVLDDPAGPDYAAAAEDSGGDGESSLASVNSAN